ncbi:DUF5658 family protein [Evansella sp. AB-rgal1]|uniref:DUF5658 family protein n=1 Tax=Evansella sp. AB-rgal1 TaxID=3242696 RepID=UPI00359D9156
MGNTYQASQHVVTINKLSIIKWIWLLSLLDALFTDVGLRLSFIEEANPLIRIIYEWNIIAFYAYKFVFPLLLLLLYPFTTNKKWIDRGIYISFFIYTLVVAYHFVWISIVLLT